jgi:hypothetical protein
LFVTAIAACFFVRVLAAAFVDDFFATASFEDLVGRLRATGESSSVERESSVASRGDAAEPPLPTPPDRFLDAWRAVAAEVRQRRVG